MAKGTIPKKDILLTGTPPVDTPSPVDKGIDFVKTGETAQVGH